MGSGRKQDKKCNGVGREGGTKGGGRNEAVGDYSRKAHSEHRFPVPSSKGVLEGRMT